MAEPAVAAVPRRGSRPDTEHAAATPQAGTYPASSQDPTLIGEVTLNTLSMLRNRAGRPRSCTSASMDRAAAPNAPDLAARLSDGRPVRSAPAASRDEPPARPPRNR